MTLRISKRTALVLAALWCGVFLVLSWFQSNDLQILNIFGFLTISLLPGLLTLFYFRIKHVPAWLWLSMAVALSLLEFLLIALLGNTLLPFFGVTRPLDSAPLLIEFALLVCVLATLCWRTMQPLELHFKRYGIFDTKTDIWFALTPLLFVVMAVEGAIRLNNGATGILTMLMLGGMLLYLCILFWKLKNVGEDALTIALFFISLSLLFMTSLRGWFITGHDIQREFIVFEITKTAGLWSMANYRDAYNACLSITMLPTMLAQLLKLPDPYVFKVFFQILFALVPGVVYCFNRNWLSKEYSFIATLYLVAFPTFFLDMPFLVRQETAFLFYALALAILFIPTLPLLWRRWLFMAFGVGIVLSHYSTTYTVLFVFLLTALALPALRLAARVRPSLTAEFFEKERKLTLGMVCSLILLSFIWTTLVTDTGGSLTRVIFETAAAVQDGFINNNRSVDTVSLISFSKPSQQDEFNQYLTDFVAPTRAEAPPDTYYSESSYDSSTLKALADDTLPPTYISALFEKIHIDLPQYVGFFGQIVAKLVGLLAIIGMALIFFRRGYRKQFGAEYFLMATFSFAFIAMNIILPVLSTEYGIFRALLQSLFVTSPLIVVAALAIVPKRAHLPAMLLSCIVAILLLGYSTGFIQQLFGGNTPLLHLNNSGRYYDTYVIHAPNTAAVHWLIAYAIAHEGPNYATPGIQVDHNSANQFALVGTVHFSDGIFPGLIRRDSLVFVTLPTLTRGEAIQENGDQIIYSYPKDFLDTNKDRIYDDAMARVYR